jgi:hypothetical protein
MSFRRTPRKYCGKKLIEKVKNATTVVYNQSVDSYMKEKEIDSSLKEELVGSMRSSSLWILKMALFAGTSVEPTFTEEELILHKEAVDNLYLEGLVRLPSSLIEDTIYCHNKKKFQRAQRTIEALVNELARRSLLDDHSR